MTQILIKHVIGPQKRNDKIIATINFQNVFKIIIQIGIVLPDIIVEKSDKTGFENNVVKM